MLALVTVGMAGLGGCAGVRQVAEQADARGREVLARVAPYRIEIVQGNAVTQEQAQAVRPGMTRQQVRSILGSPMLADPFHAERWDYIFTIRREGAPAQRRHVVAWFQGEVLERLEVPEDLPSESAFVASIDPSRPARGAAPVLELTPEQREALAARPDATPSPAAAGSGPAPVVLREFPPLEP